MYNKIKAARLTARKDKDNTLATFLATVLGDIQLRAEKAGCKDAPTDEVVQGELKAYLKRYNKEIEAGRSTDIILSEKKDIEGFLPSVATEAEIYHIVDCVKPTSMKDMGKTMAELKKTFDNFDGGVASKIIKEYING